MSIRIQRTLAGQRAQRHLGPGIALVGDLAHPALHLARAGRRCPAPGRRASTALKANAARSDAGRALHRRQAGPVLQRPARRLLHLALPLQLIPQQQIADGPAAGGQRRQQRRLVSGRRQIHRAAAGLAVHQRQPLPRAQDVALRARQAGHRVADRLRRGGGDRSAGPTLHLHPPPPVRYFPLDSHPAVGQPGMTADHRGQSLFGLLEEAAVVHRFASCQGRASGRPSGRSSGVFITLSTQLIRGAVAAGKPVGTGASSSACSTRGTW